ncbi:MAG TPA: EscU/YscU/HrcU family type III secretion system export apparatus switch protein [Candidatus Dormibacteraeota bacterium]|nr:EscU/YscU/HrcU family type III secretion system export apparatus switch protein [Candidatus Dormibacteraeota bacterium]
MSEASGDRSFEATPTRMRQARERGESPRSADLTALAAFAAAFLALLVAAAPMSALLAHAIRVALRGDSSATALLNVIPFALLPMAAAALGVGCIGLAQGGGLHVVALKLSFARLAPQENLRRMLSRETLVAMARVPLAAAIASLAIWPALGALLGLALQGAAPLQIAAGAWHAVTVAIVGALSVAALFAVLDYALAHRTWLRKLRMSAFDLKREVKESEGDPQVRGRRRALHRSLLRSGFTRIREASFVVVNPTHVAVALEYRPPQIAVPRLLARGFDESALELRRLADDAHIPVIENAPLARKIYANAELGEEIPGDLYVAVAELVVALVRSGALPS